MPDSALQPIATVSLSTPGVVTGAYAPATIWNGLVFVSGQGPIGADGSVVAGTIEEETTLTLENIRKILRAAGTDIDRIVKCTCYLADIADFARFDTAYRGFFGSHLPARTTVGASLDGIGIEIDAIAAIA